MELYLPPTWAKLTKQSVFYKTTETFKRRSKASKERMKKYWSDSQHRLRVDEKQAKPVDVFTMDGEFVATYPSARKAAIALFPGKKYMSAERCIRACRDPKQIKRSFCGYQFRDHQEDTANIEPYKRRHKEKGYTMHRKPNTFATCPIEDTYLGIVRTFGSIKEAAEAIGCSVSGIHAAMHRNGRIKGHVIRRIGERKRHSSNQYLITN